MTATPVSAVTKRASRESLVAQRQTQIVDTAVALFSERGYHEVTVQEIADRAGVSVGLIYRYAKSKQELLLLSLRQTHSLVEQALEQSTEGVDAPLDRLSRAFDAFCRVIDERRDRILLHYADGGRTDERGRREIRQCEMSILRVFVGLIDACVASKDFDPDIDTFLAAHNLKVLAHSWALKRWQFHGLTVDQYAQKQFDHFVRGVRAT